VVSQKKANFFIYIYIYIYIFQYSVRSNGMHMIQSEEVDICWSSEWLSAAHGRLLRIWIYLVSLNESLLYLQLCRVFHQTTKLHHLLRQKDWMPSMRGCLQEKMLHQPQVGKTRSLWYPQHNRAIRQVIPTPTLMLTHEQSSSTMSHNAPWGKLLESYVLAFAISLWIHACQHCIFITCFQ
jgi:hypothetical protein